MSGSGSLDGEVALVTGALGRLGGIWMEALLEAGARVVGVDLPGTEPPAAVDDLARRHGDALVLMSADVREREDLRRCAAACADGPGSPTVLVNNAGIDQPPSVGTARWRIEDVPEEVTRGILDVNVVGAFVAAQVFGGEMCRRRRGSIVNIGSVYATVSPRPELYDHLGGEPPFVKPPAYGAGKAALLNLTRYLAVHWGPHGVRVNALSPGGVAGGQDEAFRRKYCARVPLGRMAEARDLGGPLVFLASPASCYITGIELRMDGGFTA